MMDWVGFGLAVLTGFAGGACCMLLWYGRRLTRKQALLDDVELQLACQLASRFGELGVPRDDR